MYQQQQPTDQNLPNGTIPHFENKKENSSQEKHQQLINGIHSTHSSRSSSPSVRLGQIPTSQLPPTRSIPQSQLPPSRSPVTTITQKVTGLNINQGSPANQNFRTSTPNMQSPVSFRQTGAFSPISVPTPNVPQPNMDLKNGSVSSNSSNPANSVRNPNLVNINQPSREILKNNPAGTTVPPVPVGFNKPIQNPTYTSTASGTVPDPTNINQSISTSKVVGDSSQMTFTPQVTNLQRQSFQNLSNTGIVQSQSNIPTTINQSIQPILKSNESAGLNQMTSIPQFQTMKGQQQDFQNSNNRSSPARNIQNPTNLTSLNQLNQPISRSNIISGSNEISSVSQFQSMIPPHQNLQNTNSSAPATANQPIQPLPKSNISGGLNQMTSVRNLQGVNLQQEGVPNINPTSFNQLYQNPSQQRPNDAFPPQGRIQKQIPQVGVPQFPSHQTSQVRPPLLNQNNQNFTPMTPQSQQNLPNTFSTMQNPINQFRPPNAPVSSTQQPPLGQSGAMPPSHNLPPQKTGLHANRYPAQGQSAMNLQQQQNTIPPSTLQPGQQTFSSRIPLQPQQMPVQPPSAYPQPQNAYHTQAQGNYNPQQSFPNQYRSVTQEGFNKYWGMENFDLLQIPNILPPVKEKAPQISLGQEALDQANCSPDIFRCTMTKIPENNVLLQKSRLPLGVLIHPFRDLSHLPVIQCNVIVRCRACRTYINPYVFFVDSKRWKCNLCYRINELPEEFLYDPISKTYGDPSRRPEVKASTIEYIAPAEYMLRPPQPAIYLYLLDVSRLAVESGYLHSVCAILADELTNIPGDARTQIGFLAYDSSLHFYSLAEGLNRPHEMTVLDIDEVFLPTPDNLLVNLKDRMELVDELLSQLPSRYSNTFDNNSALGAALQVAYKLMMSTGGRVTVFQASLPNVGPGALTAREDPSQRSTVDVSQLNPANDFYKRLALECSAQQIAVDLFIVNSTYVDIATISGISRFSGGCVHHFPLFKISKPLDADSFERCFRRYLVRKIGFEAVMRVRCTRGLAVHTFHGNFFVRSTDLLSLPNISPDAGFGMQVAIEESLSDVRSVCFQAALLYTSSKGERRIRVHTLCLPVVSTLQDVIHSADQQCIIGLLSKMAVDRSMQSSLSDAREAFINVAVDILTTYKISQNMSNPSSGLIAPNCLKLLPLYISALLKHPAFRIGTNTRVDDRVKAMIDMKTKPLYILMQMIYPDLYPVHDLENQQIIVGSEEEQIPLPPKLQLSARSLVSKGAFLLDMGEHMLLMVLPDIAPEFLIEVLGVNSYNDISDQMFEIPALNNLRSQRLRQFISYLNEDKPFAATIQVISDSSLNRVIFLERLIEDRGENALSYHEFLQHIKSQVK